MGLTEEAREAVIDKHRTAGTINAMNSQWKRWHIWVAESAPTDDQELYSEEWQGWPTGPHITTSHLINFLTQLRTDKDSTPAFSTLRGYKAHLVEMLLKSGSLLDYIKDSRQRDLVDDVIEDKRRSIPDKPRHDHFFEMDAVFNHLKGEAKFSGKASKKIRRSRTATIVRMHTLARSDDLAKMELGSLLENRKNQSDKSSHWVYKVNKDHLKGNQEPIGVVLHVPKAKTDSPHIEVGATPQEPELCIVTELMHHCDWLRSIPAEEHQAGEKDKRNLFISANPVRNPHAGPDSKSKRHIPLKPVTLAGDVISVMHEAGIDTTIWRSHALRGAAASDMHDKGVQLEMICQLGRWASASTFEKYYKRAKQLHTFSVAETVVQGMGLAARGGEPRDAGAMTRVEDHQEDTPNPNEGVSIFKTVQMNARGLNITRPIPEAGKGHNCEDHHCWTCNAADARMIHCSLCNLHLHRSHFGSSPADHQLAESDFKHHGWKCENCEEATSWSTFNVSTTDKKKETELRNNALWHVGSLSKEKKEEAEKIMSAQ